MAVLAVVFGVLLVGVGQIGAQDQKLKLIIVAHGGPGNPFWVTVIKGMNDAAAIFGVDAQWLSPNNDDVEGMVKYLDDAVAAQPDGLASHPRTQTSSVMASPNSPTRVCRLSS